MNIDREAEKERAKEFSLALMSVDSNKPVCKTCGERFMPDKEEIEVDLPEDDVQASRTSYVDKPDYCSKECRVSDSI